MVIAFEDLTKRSLSNTLVDFKSICNMVVHFANILSFIVVKSAVFGAIRRRQYLVFALHQVYEVDLVVLEDLGLLVVE